MKIWFDMDGTIADFYAVQGWLEMLIAEDATPYAVARPLLNLSRLARLLNTLQAQGHEIGVISWLSKCGSPAFDAEVTAVKMAWLAKHLPSVHWDEIKIVRYGLNKWEQCGAGILFDDEEGNRNAWKGDAYEPTEILTVLKALAVR